MSSDNQMETDPYAVFQAGDKVRHPKFGDGQIIQRSGTGENTKFVVKFAEEGEKRLMACYAKLKRIAPVSSEEKAEKAKAALEGKPRKAAALEEMEGDEIEEEELDEGEIEELDEDFVDLDSGEEEVEDIQEDDEFEN